MSLKARRPAPITVTRYDPSTGEVLGTPSVVGANHFENKLPSRPNSPDVHAWRNFWGAHSECLTREERAKIAKGRSIASERPLDFKPAWQKGDVLEVASDLKVEVQRVEWSRDGYITIFRLIDHRPLLMAQTMGGAGIPWVDEHGYPVTYSESVKEAARVDGAYTRSTSQGIADAGEVLDESVLAKLHLNVSAGNARRQRRRQKTVSLKRLEERLAEAKSKHWATGHIERQIERLKERKAK